MSAAPRSGADEQPADSHLGDLVTDLVDGRLGDADPALVLDHLDSCAACRAELADAVVAAAALRGVAGLGKPDRGSPPAAGTPAPAETPVPVAEPGSLRPHRRGVPVLTGALALVVLVAAVLGGVAVGRHGGSGQGGATSASPPLTALFREAGTTRGAAVITGSGATRRMTIEAEAPATAGTVVLVWLEATGEPTQRVGALDTSGHGSFVMSAATAAAYTQVVLSDQPGSATRLDDTAVVARANLA